MNSSTHQFDAGAAMALPRLLAINFFPSFFPPLSGGEQRSFHLLDALSRHYRVTSVTPTYPGTRNEVVRFSQTFEEHRFTKTMSYQQWGNEFRRLGLDIAGSDLALSLAAQSHSKLMDAVKRLWDDTDVVLLQHPTALPLVSHLDLSGKRLVYLSHNCEFELASQRLTEGAGHDFLMLIGQLEYRLCHLADHIAVVSREDELKMRALYGLAKGKFVLVPNGSVARFPTTNDPELDFPATKPASAVFVGSNWPPNVEAVQFIVETLAPHVADVTFEIVGSVCRSFNGAVAPPNVRMRYELDDAALGALMRETHIGLNPMKSGGGSNVKLADYLAHGLRILSTSVGARGFPTDLPNCHISSLEGMAERLAALVSTPPDAKTRASWRRSSRELWHWPTIAAPLSERFRKPATVTTGTTMVVLNEFPVRGASNGGEARISGLYKAVGSDDLTTILSFGRDKFRANLLGENLVCLEFPATTAQKDSVQEANKVTYASVNDLVYPRTVASNKLWLQMADLVLAHADGVVFSHPFMWPVYEGLVTRRRFVHDSHNVEAQLKREALETHRWRDELCDEVKRQEAAMMAGAKLIAACSMSDADYFRKHGAAHVIVAENGVDLTSAKDPALSEALGGEATIGSPDGFKRNIYVLEEFDQLQGLQFGDAAYQAVLKRVPTPDESAEAGKASRSARERGGLIAKLMASAENKTRVYVLGARKAAGMDETIAVFIGSGHRPNLTAAEFLASLVAPRIPDIQVLIVGDVGHSMDRGQLAANVFTTGFVSSAMKSYLLRRATVGLNPMIGGGGSNLKVPDYIAHGLPVVSSDFGRRGFALTAEQGLYSAPLSGFSQCVAETAARFKTVQFDPAPALQAIQEIYDWDRISARYLSETGKALQRDPSGDLLVVCEDASMLTSGGFSSSARLLAHLADRGRVKELFVQSRPMPAAFVREWKARLPAAIENVTLASHDRELGFSNAATLQHDNILFGELDVVVTTATPETVLAACEGVDILRPVLLSGAGNVVAADHSWRFLSDDVLVALPEHVQTLVLTGKAHRMTEVKVESVKQGTTLTYQIKGSFEIRAPVDDTVLRIASRLIDADVDENGSQIHLQLNRLAGVTETCEIAADLWISSAQVLHEMGLPSERLTFLNGRQVRAVSQELQILLANRAATVSRILCLGSQQFARSVDAQVVRACGTSKVVAFDGVRLHEVAHARQDAIDMPPDDVELGLAKNRKEQTYLSLAYAKPGSIVLLVERVNGEVARFARALKKELATAFPDVDVVVVTSEGKRAARTGEAGDKVLNDVTIVCPHNPKADLALLGMARLVVVRDSACHFARVPMLLELLSARGVVWRTGNAQSIVFDKLQSVTSVAQVVEHVWRDQPAEKSRFALTPWPTEKIDAILNAPSRAEGKPEQPVTTVAAPG